jgi:hypothetical protein
MDLLIDTPSIAMYDSLVSAAYALRSPYHLPDGGHVYNNHRPPLYQMLDPGVAVSTLLETVRMVVSGSSQAISASVYWV